MDKIEIKKKRTFKKTMTEKALEANRINAKKSTGPKFKKRTQLALPSNLKHGILASIPVLPMIENQKDWDIFVIGLKNDLKPDGTLENLLVERIATLYWRLSRMARFEQEKIARDINNVPQVVASTWRPKPGNNNQFSILDEYEPCNAGQVEKEAKIYPKVLKLVEDLFDNEQKDELDQDLAKEVAKLSGQLYIEHLNTKEREKPEKERKSYELSGNYMPIDLTSSKKVIRILKMNSKDCNKSYKDHLRDIYQKASKYKEFVEKDWVRMKEAIALRRFDKLNPLDCLTGKDSVIKLEAHINKQILQNLHELQRIQGMRIGISRPPEAIDVTGVEV